MKIIIILIQMDFIFEILENPNLIFSKVFLYTYFHLGAACVYRHLGVMFVCHHFDTTFICRHCHQDDVCLSSF